MTPLPSFYVCFFYYTSWKDLGKAEGSLLFGALAGAAAGICAFGTGVVEGSSF